ncbi:hypothetical protein K437DRAFT_273537 [Tilletiaria anomala UBC 951]|uniref:F-box domain-containing protein n=1 Tax=Tilletiaria anomala (strain ATCC 24038 / CBS 436.72 / UBC 951) TaxID=1037660 RepID=A0A066WA54_TILAU|nr:uncharacterized protein K437DRAFT_273537 [Tilletiaria anomala UBC 951]KDN47949.1 hypothetical protein K437DRAFT_273537 [Tilletiaria anomala UBC 951]
MSNSLSSVHQNDIQPQASQIISSRDAQHDLSHHPYEASGSPMGPLHKDQRVHGHLAVPDPPSSQPTSVDDALGPLDDAYFARKRAALRSQHKGKGRPRLNGSESSADHPSPSTRSDVGIQNYLRSAIGEIPTEILVRVFSYLDVISLAQVALVCSFWAAIVHDDATWRLAFATNFDVQGGDETLPTLRRTHKLSWKAEYVRRSDLLRRWRKSRTATILTDPRIGLLSGIAISLQHKFMLSTSVANGVASRSDPFTGKVAKGMVEALTGEGFVTSVSASAVDADGSRVVWGFESGNVCVSLLGRQGANPRGIIKTVSFPARDSHTGPVNDVALPFASKKGGVHAHNRSADRQGQRAARLGEAGQAFVTAGEDGTVRLWSIKLRAAVWVGEATQALFQEEEARLDDASEHNSLPRQPLSVPLEKVDYDPTGTIIAAARDGTVLCWHGFNMELLEKGSIAAGPILSPRHVAVFRPSKASLYAPADLVLEDEADRSEGRVSLLLRFKEDDGFWRHDISFGENLPMAPKFATCRFDAQGQGNITCLRADFDIGERTSASPLRSPFVRSASRRGAFDGDIPALILGPSAQELRTSEIKITLRERKFVCVGTGTGKVFVYPWDIKGAAKSIGGDQTWLHLSEPQTRCSPSFALEVGVFEVTALDFNAAFLLCGTSDGSVKVFNALTGQLVRTFADRAASRHPARMLAAGELTMSEALRFRVTQIITTEDAFVAIIGSHVLAWRCETAMRSTLRKAGKSSSGKSRHPLRRLDSKIQAQNDLEDEVMECTESVRSEAARTQAELRTQQYWQEVSTLDDMTEQEAFAYAMMLSRDQQEASGRTGHGGNGIIIDDEAELQAALDAIALSEARTGSPHEASEGASPDASFASSPGPSPGLQGVSSPRAWQILAHAGSAASNTTDLRSGAHSKVQTVQVPRSARRNAADSATRSAFAEGSALPEIGSPTEWPSVSPLSTSLRSSSMTSSVSAPRSFSASSPRNMPSPSSVPNSAGDTRCTSFANATTAATGAAGGGAGTDADRPSSSLGAWAAGNPIRQAAAMPSSRGVRIANSPSLLARDLQRQKQQQQYIGSSAPASLLPQNASPMRGSSSASPANGSMTLLVGVDGMDDDLRFAIELSLAEEKSRQQSQT